MNPNPLKVVLFTLVGVVIITVIIAWPVMLLWNWLMPFLFGLPVINFWEALGISILSSLLFKSSNSSK